MSYTQIDITEVGPAEYPLIAVLRDTVFAEFKHRYAATFEEQVDGRRDVLALIAHLEGNPVGYKVGYQDKPRRFYSWTGGVLRDYRGQGLARRMQDWQHGWLRARGYHSVSFNSFNKFRGMLHLGLSSGFVVNGVDVQSEGECSIHFKKDLTQPDPPRRDPLPAAEVERVESVSPNYHGLIARIASAARPAAPVTEADVDRWMAAPDAVALVAFVDGKPAGAVTGRADVDPGVYRCTLGGVSPAWQGRGVGAALLRHLARSARSFGYLKTRLFAPRQDTPLLRAALNAGYDVAGLTFDAAQRSASIALESSPDANSGTAS